MRQEQLDIHLCKKTKAKYKNQKPKQNKIKTTKKEFWYIPHPYKNWIKIDHLPKCKAWNYNASRRQHRRNSLWPWVRQRFLEHDTKSTIHKFNLNFIQMKTPALQKTLLREKASHTGRKYLQIIYLIKDMYLKFISNPQNSMKRKHPS